MQPLWRSVTQCRTIWTWLEFCTVSTDRTDVMTCPGQVDITCNQSHCKGIEDFVVCTHAVGRLQYQPLWFHPAAAMGPCCQCLVKHGPTASVGWDQGGSCLGLPTGHVRRQKSSMPWYVSLSVFISIWSSHQNVSERWQTIVWFPDGHVNRGYNCLEQ